MSMTTTIERFTQWARNNPQRQYTALMGLLSNPRELLACYDEQPGNKERGIDGISKADYADAVEERIKALSDKSKESQLPAETVTAGVYSEKRRQGQAARHTAALKIG